MGTMADHPKGQSQVKPLNNYGHDLTTVGGMASAQKGLNAIKAKQSSTGAPATPTGVNVTDSPESDMPDLGEV